MRTRTFLGVAAAGGLLLALGSAATASNSFTNTNTTVGYGAQSVTGATIHSVVYTPTGDGTQIVDVTLQTVGDTSGNAAYVGFTVGGVAGAVTKCGAGAYDGTAYTTYDCAGLAQDVTAAQKLDITVE